MGGAWGERSEKCACEFPIEFPSGRESTSDTPLNGRSDPITPSTMGQMGSTRWLGGISSLRMVCVVRSAHSWRSAAHAANADICSPRPHRPPRAVSVARRLLTAAASASSAHPGLPAELQRAPSAPLKAAQPPPREQKTQHLHPILGAAALMRALLAPLRRAAGCH